MLGDLLSGTATEIGGAAGVTLIDARLKDKSRNQDDYFNDQVIYIVTGTGVAGDERYISDFTATSGTVTPYQAFSAQVPNASTYQIHRLWTPTEKRRALNQAIYDVYPWVARLHLDETMQTVAEKWAYRLGDWGSGAAVSYGATTLTDTGKAWQTNQFAGLKVVSGANSATIASNTATVLTVGAWSPTTPTAADAYQIIYPIVEVFDVAYQTSTDYTTYPYTSIPFEMQERQGSKVIQLLAYPPPSRYLRVTGRGRLTEWTSTITSASEIGHPQLKLIYYLAAYHLFSKAPSLVPNQDRDFYEGEAKRYYSKWLQERAVRRTVVPPRRIWRTGMGMGEGTDLEYLAGFDTP